MKPNTAKNLFICLLAITATTANAAETTWQKDIRPLFERHCAACHDSATPEYARFKKEKELWTQKGVGMRMDTYSHLISFVGWPNSGALMRRLDDGSGKLDHKPGNMYQYLGTNEEERQKNLAIFKQWVGSWNLKRWAELTKDEINGLQVKY